MDVYKVIGIIVSLPVLFLEDLADVLGGQKPSNLYKLLKIPNE